MRISPMHHEVGGFPAFADQSWGSGIKVRSTGTLWAKSLLALGLHPEPTDFAQPSSTLNPGQLIGALMIRIGFPCRVPLRVL